MTGATPAATRAKVWIVIFCATLGLTRGQGPVTLQAFGNLGFGPILHPGELAGGQSVPLCNVTYRMLGSGLLPVSEGFKAAATAAVGQLFATGNLTIDVLSIAAAQPAPETAVGAASDQGRKLLGATGYGENSFSRAMLAAEAPAAHSGASPLAPNGTDMSMPDDAVDVLVASNFSASSVLPALGSPEAQFQQLMMNVMWDYGYAVEILSLGDCLPTSEALPYLARLDLPVVQAAELTMLVQNAPLPFGIHAQSVLAFGLGQQLTTQADTAYFNITAVQEQPSVTTAGLGNVTVTVIVQHDTARSLWQVLTNMQLTPDTASCFAPVEQNLADAGLPVNVTVLNWTNPLPNATLYDMAVTWLANNKSTSAALPETARHSGVDVGVIVGVAGGVLLLVTLTGLFVAGTLMRRRRRLREAAYRDQTLLPPGKRSKASHGSSAQLSSTDGSSPYSTGREPGKPSTYKELACHGKGDVAVTLTAPVSGQVTQDSASTDWSERNSEQTVTGSVHCGDMEVPALLECEMYDGGTSWIHICLQADGSPWKLGSGAFGHVFKAVREGKEEVAVKLLPIANAAQLKAVQREIKLLQVTRDNPHLVTLLGSHVEADYAFLVLELMRGGDLGHAIPTDQHSMRWYGHGRHVALAVAQGLQGLHAKQIQHFDLKSGNILLDSDYTAKISDVGLSRLINATSTTQATAPVGTFAYSAPELLLGNREPCTFAADMYSLGVVLWEIVCGEQPRRGQLRHAIVPNECPSDIDALIDSCITLPAVYRPTADEAVRVIQRCLHIEEPS